MTLTDHGNNITLINQIVQRLTTFVHHNATNLPAPPYPVPPAPSVIARPQVPVDPDAGNILLGCLMEGVQRWMDFWMRWMIVFICRGRIWRWRGTSVIILGGIWRMDLWLTGFRILNVFDLHCLKTLPCFRLSLKHTLVPQTKLDFSCKTFRTILRLALFIPTFLNSTTSFHISNSLSRWKFPNSIKDLRTNSRKLS